MTLQTIPLDAVLPPKGNPRRTFDSAQIISLAESIRADGVLQNLVVVEERADEFRVISGKRRYLALQRLRKEGVIDGTYQVPVEIKSDVSEYDAIRIATIENVQREQLHPMDEAEAFAKMLQAGGAVEAITDKTGLSLLTVKRRLALATLCADAKKALRAGTITRTFAEALTLGTAKQQRAVLESLSDNALPDADDVRAMLLEQKPVLSMAIFPREKYTGTITTDLFADDETSYFDDKDQFLSLQKEAVEELAEQRRQTAAWVELSYLYTVPWWRFRDAAEGEPGGTVINLHPSGSVEIRDGLVPHEVRQTVADSAQRTPMEPKPTVRERPAFSAPLIRYVAMQKSAAVQAALLEEPRKAKEVATLLMLRGLRVDYGVRLAVHACHSTPGDDRVSQRAHRTINELADRLAGCLGPTAYPGERPVDGGVKKLSIARSSKDLFEALGKLNDHDLDMLMVLLPILCFGQTDVEEFDTSDSLFNAVAVSIGVDIRAWWTPDTTFLMALRQDQVMVVAEESGAAEKLHGLAKRSKREAVAELVNYFVQAENERTPDNEQAATWLPSYFRFSDNGSSGAQHEI